MISIISTFKIQIQVFKCNLKLESSWCHTIYFNLKKILRNLTMFGAGDFASFTQCRVQTSILLFFFPLLNFFLKRNVHIEAYKLEQRKLDSILYPSQTIQPGSVQVDIITHMNMNQNEKFLRSQLLHYLVVYTQESNREILFIIFFSVIFFLTCFIELSLVIYQYFNLETITRN